MSSGRIGLAIVFVLTACGGGQSQEVVKPRPDKVGYEPTAFDRCPVLRSCFGEASQYESCPKPVAIFNSASTEITARSKNLLNELVKELKQVESISKLQLTGYALKTEPPYVAGARVKAIKKWLLDHGVSESLLETDTVISKGSEGFVSFAPTDCSGDHDGDDSTTPAAIFLVL